VAALRASSLLRTLRTDKTTLAALDATLHAYRAGEESQLPFWKMALAPASLLEERSRAVVDGLPAGDSVIELVDGFSTTGGGSAPSSQIPTPVIRITPAHLGAKSFAEGLRAANPPVVARIESGAVELNLRTVDPEQDAHLRDAVETLLGLG
jgi:L-seryl-tRNA(Ser) seleniumtransferase